MNDAAMLICQRLFILLTPEAGEPSLRAPNQNQALSSGLLADLAMRGLVSLGGGKDPRVDLTPNATDREPETADAVLEFGLAALSTRRGRRAGHVVGASWFSPTKTIADQFAAAGLITIEATQLLGLTRERYVVADSRLKTALRTRLITVLVGAQAPSPEDAAVLGVLQEIGVAHRLFADALSGVSRLELRNTVTEIAEQVHGDERTLMAVRRSIDSMQAVIASAAAASIL